MLGAKMIAVVAAASVRRRADQTKFVACLVLIVGKASGGLVYLDAGL